MLPPCLSLKTQPRGRTLHKRKEIFGVQKLKYVAVHLCDLGRRFIRPVHLNSSLHHRWDGSCTLDYDGSSSSSLIPKGGSLTNFYVVAHVCRHIVFFVFSLR